MTSFAHIHTTHHTLHQGWSKFGEKLTDFQQPENRDKAVQCLNHLITNALQHIPDVLEYLSRIRNQSVFNFCAIPQVGGCGLILWWVWCDNVMGVA